MFEINITLTGQYYWVLKAFNGQVIASSNKYNSHAAVINSIWSVQKIAGTAEIKDLT